MSNSIGLYIHIPFCKHKCPYCDFFSGNADENAFDNYVIELKDKIKTEEAISKENTTVEIKEAIIEDDKVQEAVSALQVLGYSKKEIEVAMEKLDTSSLSVEDIIRQGLNNLAR